MHAVTDPDERRATGLAEHDLRVTEVGCGFEEREHTARAGDENRDDQADHQRPHLAAHGIVDHPRVTADERVLEAPDQKPVAVDLRARGDLRWHGRSHRRRAEAVHRRV